VSHCKLEYIYIYIYVAGAVINTWWLNAGICLEMNKGIVFVNSSVFGLYGRWEGRV